MTPPVRGFLGLVAALMPIAITAQPAGLHARTVVETGATSWKYLDIGVEPPEGWQQPGFDDSNWSTGKAPLGYGDPGLGTIVDFGGKPAAQHVTTWLRHEFKAPALATGERLVLLTCVDDGAIVSLNGKEIVRFNMPVGNEDSKTLAGHAMNDKEEGFYLRVPFEPGSWNVGEANVLVSPTVNAVSSRPRALFDADIGSLGRCEGLWTQLDTPTAKARGILSSTPTAHTRQVLHWLPERFDSPSARRRAF
jgi:hypothetical protein